MKRNHDPLIFDSRFDRLVGVLCRRTNHFRAKQRRRMRGEITCERCNLVIGYWR